RIAAADRVVLMADRRPEERHDSVAHDLVDGALVVVDRLHHPLKHGVEELAGLFGIPVSQQLHRALQIGEEHRDLLSLPLERALRGEDLLGEVLGGVGLRCREAGGGLTGDRRTAGTAEPLPRRDFGVALRTRQSQTRAAVFAELQSVATLQSGTGDTASSAYGAPRLVPTGTGV